MSYCAGALFNFQIGINCIDTDFKMSSGPPNVDRLHEAEEAGIT